MGCACGQRLCLFSANLHSRFCRFPPTREHAETRSGWAEGLPRHPASRTRRRTRRACEALPPASSLGALGRYLLQLIKKKPGGHLRWLTVADLAGWVLGGRVGQRLGPWGGWWRAGGGTNILFEAGPRLHRQLLRVRQWNRRDSESAYRISASPLGRQSSQEAGRFTPLVAFPGTPFPDLNPTPQTLQVFGGRNTSVGRAGPGEPRPHQYKNLPGGLTGFWGAGRATG